MGNLIPKELIEKMKIPKLYETEEISNPTCHVKLFTPDSVFTWFIIEISIDEDIAFGYVVSPFESELGYFSLKELESIKGALGLGVERDTSFTPTALEIVRKSR
ncbi:hypothetical protein CJ673_11355 [Aliarcobacter cryaerophilus]|uniref:DUF2958 domain-containing protein n=1 Tax=Aliarcobacter cryaerophilus TaxID=28198 RepID=A0A2S9SYQ5_9BACT|nr:DUF2958 domain-containing protein [Aliarcobacter cryaerophilus]PRM91733.1 hypothetical protein CJ673_11355 [Aliarcobacter cryaerophilus]